MFAKHSILCLEAKLSEEASYNQEIAWNQKQGYFNGFRQAVMDE